MNWEDMKVFLAIAYEGGLKKAARRLNMHHSSCARRINMLEDSLKLKLFERLPAGYVLTSGGEELFKSAELIQQEFHSIERNLLGKDQRIEGNLCLTLPNGFATHLLMPDLQQFSLDYPEVNLEINMSYSVRDLSNREADIAIRHVDNPPDSLIGKRVARVHHSAYASVQYLDSHDPINQPQHCQWLGWGNKNGHLKWPEKHKYPDIPVKTNMYSDVLQLAAIQANMGIASLPCFLADGVDGIVRISGADVTAADWVWVLAHKDMATNAKVRLLMSYIEKAFQRYANRMNGLDYCSLEE